MGDDLCEVNWFKQSFGSWFLGDYVCEGDDFFSVCDILLIEFNRTFNLN